ncbi:MAG: phosphatidylglycerophosphatase A [Burkholderiales bacterium]|nr:phosphatidylglycerophosphatase A [Burkholderiales bacterium]
MITSPTAPRPERRAVWPDLAFLRAHPAHWIALGCGAGLSPRAPGTLGTLAALPPYALLTHLPTTVYWAVLVAAALIGVWACGRTGRALGQADHPAMVWDELTAFLIVLPFAPASPWGWLAAFGLFRLFDIWKPFPIGWLERRVTGGGGVMLDDLVAAAYSIAILQGVQRWM